MLMEGESLSVSPFVSVIFSFFLSVFLDVFLAIPQSVTGFESDGSLNVFLTYNNQKNVKEVFDSLIYKKKSSLLMFLNLSCQ